MNGFAPGLALIERLKATRKWAIRIREKKKKKKKQYQPYKYIVVRNHLANRARIRRCCSAKPVS